MQIIREMKEQQADGLVGLQNYSYFCYLNSCLQCLISIEQLRDHYLYKEYLKLKDLSRIRNTFRLSTTLTKFF